MKPEIAARNSANAESAADDEALAQAAKDDRAAFTLLYHRYVERVYRYAFSRVGSAQEAEDITAQVFVDALAALPNYHSRGQFVGWLFTLAYRRCADYHRRPKPEPLAETLAAPANDPAGRLIHREMIARLEALLGELNGDALEMLRLHYAAGLTYRQMAYVLGRGRSEGSVKVAMSRLLQKLKTRWVEEDD